MFVVWNGSAWAPVGAPVDVSDAVFSLVNDADPTRKALFSLSGISTGTTRIFTLPNSSSELAAVAGTQTFTGSKTFSGVVTVSGVTKTLNLGTGGAAGSITAVNIGSATAGAGGVTVVNTPTVTLSNAVTQVGMPQANLTAQLLGLGGATAEGRGRRAFALFQAVRHPEPLVWILPAHVPELPMLRGLPRGVGERLHLFRKVGETDLLWCVEEALRAAPVGLVIAEPEKLLSLTAGRRFQLAAETGRTTGIMLIREDSGSNATETRWDCESVASTAADSTLHQRTLSKNKIGTIGSWVLNWNGASAGVARRMQAGMFRGSSHDHPPLPALCRVVCHFEFHLPDRGIAPGRVGHLC